MGLPQGMSDESGLEPGSIEELSLNRSYIAPILLHNTQLTTPNALPITICCVFSQEKANIL